MAKHVALWMGLSFLFHLAWEALHVRLYTIWDEPDRLYVAGAVLHCTLGDVIIATAAFALAAWLFRRADWPMPWPVRGTLVVVAAAMTFTVWSEWYNVYRVDSWAYAPEMPTIFGIGLTPLSQWLLLPPVTTWTLRRLVGAVPNARRDPR